MTAWSGRLFLDAGAFVFLGPGGVAERHAHHVVQLVWARDGELTLTLDTPVRRRAALVPSDVAHAFDASGETIALVLVDPHAARGAALDRRARLAPGAELALSVPFPSLDLSAIDAARWCDRLVSELGATAAPPGLSDAARAAITFVEDTIDGAPRLPDAARRIGLSPTRLTHLFTREVGIPFRRFVLWTRVKRAVEETRAGADLTRAAVAAGFSDSAHLSRTFRAMFGLPPSTILPFVEIIGTAWSRPQRSSGPGGAVAR
jgi:AraC-like DNA-binding protein